MKNPYNSRSSSDKPTRRASRKYSSVSTTVYILFAYGSAVV